MTIATFDYYPAVLYALDKISQGMTRTKACAAANITVAVFVKYVKEDERLQDLMVDAEQQGHDAMADALLSPDNNLLYGNTNPQMAKIVSDNIKWYLSKFNPKKFGEKVEIKHEITLDRAITDAMYAGRLRAIEGTTQPALPAPSNEDAIDVEFEIVDSEAELLAELLS